MATRNNIESSRVEGLLPRQLISDSAALIEFLKEYYRFINQESGPSYVLNTLLENRDLDTAVDEFISLIHNEVGSGFIKNLIADKPNLYKHIHEFYQAKGSLDSFQLLFKLLFNTNVEITLPKDQILIASDGRWKQQTSVFIEAISGDALQLTGRFITIASEFDSLEVEVERVIKVNETDPYYQLYILKTTDTNRILTGSVINQYEVNAIVIESLSNIEIIYSGQNFDVPQYVNVEYQSTGTKFRISELIDGGISRLKIISYGIGYTNDFYARIIPRREVEVIDNIDLVVIDEVDIATEQEDNPTHAILKFSNTPIALYTGEYTTNNGFLSDDIYLQDNYYYQQYSYVIKAGIQINNYRNIVNKTVHPAGMIFFGKFEITNFFDVSGNIEILAKYFRIRLESPPVFAPDTIAVIFEKVLSDEVDVENQDIYNIDFRKELETETDPVEDVYSIEYFKNTSNIITTDNDYTVIGFNKNISTSTNPIIETQVIDFNKELSTSTDPVGDIYSISFSKSLETSIDPVEDTAIIDFYKGLTTSTSGFIESISTDFTKILNDEITQLSNVSSLFNKELSSSSNVENEDIFSFDYAKNIIGDSIATADNIEFLIFFGLNFDNSVSTLSIISNDFNKVLSTSQTINSNISTINVGKALSESINNNESAIAELNPYTLEDYFAEDYTAGKYTIV